MTGGRPSSLTDVAWPVRTQRLLLRPATASDLPVVWQWRRDPDVTRWMNNRADDLTSYVARLSAPEKLATILAVELHDGSELDGQVVMDLHVRVTDSPGQSDLADRARATAANLGWSMDPRVHGRGLATEAVRGALGICFDRLGLHRVEADCYSGNGASARLMERVGMRHEGHRRAVALHRDHGWVDMDDYAILDTDWKALTP